MDRIMATEMKRFYTFPFGTKNARIPKANLAESTTSAEIVKNEEKDAFYFRALEKNNIWLNRAQIEAVRSTDGPLLVLAGAGTGKTSTLISRTGYLINVKHVDMRNILLMTFTKKAADEMKERIAGLPFMENRQLHQLEVRTYHSFFLRILRFAGYKQEILSNESYKQLILKKKMREMGCSEEMQPETILAMLSLYKMNGQTVGDFPSKTKGEKEIKAVATFYEQWKKDHHHLDFDDILTEAYSLLKTNVDLLLTLQDRFQYVMVDEFQDSNVLQYELIRLIAYPHNHLCVVGDDDQTIYTFQGAKNELILQYDQQFPQAKVIPLTINYRSNACIVGLGNQVILNNVERKEKTLTATKNSQYTPIYFRPNTTEVEAEWIVNEIREKQEAGIYNYHEIAILYRTASQSRAIFEKMAMENIPFYDYGMGSLFFYEQNSVKQVLGYLQLAMNPLDWYAFEQILPTMYIARENGMKRAHGLQVSNPKKHIIDHVISFPNLHAYQLKAIEQKRNLLKKIPALSPKEAIQRIRIMFYDRYIEAEEQHTLTSVKDMVKEQLDELEASASRFQTIEELLLFIKEMKHYHEQMKQQKQSANVVQLMTIHKSKGLEFPVVFMIGASEGILPHRTAIESKKFEDRQIHLDQAQLLEEERRLAYVAITRAKEQLYISSPSFYRGKTIEVSRFLLEPFQTEEEKRKNQMIQKEELIDAWLCTATSCRAWQRVESNESVTKKQCPLCSMEMERGKKKLIRKN